MDITIDTLYLVERNEEMDIDKLKGELKREIEIKRNILNEMVVKGVDNEEILELSEELDQLIEKYIKLDLM